MADLSACHRAVKRQLFRRNESLLLLICIAAFLFLFFVYQKANCDDGSEKSFYQFGFKRNEQSISQVKKDTFLFIMVLTSPKGKERRYALRKTWLSDIKTLNSSVIARFIIGVRDLPQEDIKNLEEENKRYNDILFLPDFKDSYYELTNKVLQTFKWIDQNVNSSYLLKVDDDSFVRLDVIISELKSTSPRKNLYWGFFRGDAHVKFSGSWAEKKWHLCDRYLPYAQGGGYILSSDLVNFIARNADLLEIFNSEDVSVGECVMAILPCLLLAISSLTSGLQLFWCCSAGTDCPNFHLFLFSFLFFDLFCGVPKEQFSNHFRW